MEVFTFFALRVETRSGKFKKMGSNFFYDVWLRDTECKAFGAARLVHKFIFTLYK